MNEAVIDQVEKKQKGIMANRKSEVDSEEPFEIEETFFSRTDKRGVISAYNDVFVRIAGYSPQELKGAPHKLIRHSDMPKAAFWLLWKGIEAGYPVGAYVKNRAKNGRYYWVFAVVCSVGDGYISVRIKPTSPILGIVKDVYKDIRRLELEQKLPAEESAKLLLARLKEIGFANYGAFQSHAIFKEFEARRNALKEPAFPELMHVDEVVDAADCARNEISELAGKFHAAEILTANLNIYATKLKAGRSTIYEIAKNYALMLRDIQRNLDEMVTPEATTDHWDTHKERCGFFLLCSSRLLDEVYDHFYDNGVSDDRLDKREELDNLLDMKTSFKRRADQAYSKALQDAVAIRRKCEFIRRMILGLSTVRIACRVEAGVLRENAGGLNTIVSRLDDFYDEIETHLGKIEKAIGTIIGSTDGTKFQVD
jgi:aerotaxis receptor